jgi:hypothetical protein
MNSNFLIPLSTNEYEMLLKSIIYDKKIMNCISSFMDDDFKLKFKKIFKKSSYKDKKKYLKEIIKTFILDFGQYQEKLNYRVTEEKSLVINTNIFNINKNYLKQFTTVFHEASNDEIELEKEELYEYLRVLPKFEFYLRNEKQDCIKISKALVPYEFNKNTIDDDENEKNKYEMFYEMSDLNLDKIDFSDPEKLKERQQKILEIMNQKNNKIFYPLEFISGVNYWSIILCHGGYFAAGFFLRDKIIEHKSDHKYVARKKAGQRQINKDKSKKIQSSGK